MVHLIVLFKKQFQDMLKDGSKNISNQIGISGDLFVLNSFDPYEEK